MPLGRLDRFGAETKHIHINGAAVNHWVRSLIIVGESAKNLHTHHAFAQQFFLCAEATGNDVTEQILAWAAGAKRNAARHLFEDLLNALLGLLRWEG